MEEELDRDSEYVEETYETLDAGESVYEQVAAFRAELQAIKAQNDQMTAMLASQQDGAAQKSKKSKSHGAIVALSILLVFVCSIAATALAFACPVWVKMMQKPHTVVLDYQGASVTSDRQISVNYGESIPDLPTDLALPHSRFCGWYTQPNCGGTQVADADGNIPVVSILTKENFDITDGFVYLYAGFVGQSYTVAFVNDNGEREEYVVDYNTPIQSITPTFRSNGKAVLSWSKAQNDTQLAQVFNGKVTEDMVLYAAVWAPILELDANGGEDMAAIITKAGENINLPTPLRTDYTFIGWYTLGGVAFTQEVMPADSQKLVAKWNAQLLFDTNGGVEVQNISQPEGTTIALPTTEKEGYFFAGWYTSEGLRYDEDIMPKEAVHLVAKYNKIETKIITIIGEGSGRWSYKTSPTLDQYFFVDLSDLYDSGVQNVNLLIHYSSYAGDHGITGHMNWYSTNNVSSVYKVLEYSEAADYYSSAEYNRTYQLELVSPKYWICYYANGYGDYCINDFYIKIEYPDMTTLY